MRIYLSIDKGKKVVDLPFVPLDSCDIKLPFRTTETVGSRTLLGPWEPAEFSVSLNWPKKKVKKGSLAADEFVKFIQDAMKNKKIIRVVALRSNGKTYFNRSMVITEFSKKLPLRNGDVPLTLNLKER